MNRTRYTIVACVALGVLFLTWQMAASDGENPFVVLILPVAQALCGLLIYWWRLHAALAFSGIVTAAYLVVAVFLPDMRAGLVVGIAIVAAVLMVSWCFGHGLRLLWTAGQLPRKDT